MPPDAWDSIAPFLESDHFGEALNLAVRDVAFRRHPRDMDEFIRSIGECAKSFAVDVVVA